MVSDDDLEGLSLELGTSWSAFARRLDFSEAEIQRFNHDNKELTKKCHRMLCRWKEKRGLSGATYKVLYEALCHEYVDRKDLAGRFCILGSSDESKKKKDSTSELLREDSSRTKIYE